MTDADRIASQLSPTGVPADVGQDAAFAFGPDELKFVSNTDGHIWGKTYSAAAARMHAAGLKEGGVVLYEGASHDILHLEYYQDPFGRMHSSKICLHPKVEPVADDRPLVVYK